MGSGKSSVGAFLSQRLGCFLLDCDSLIEQTYQMSILALFETFGESYFRGIEQKLEEWLLKQRFAVVATGGGMPLFCHRLPQIGKVFYLNLPFEVIAQRLNVQEKQKRPLFQDTQKAKALYEQRRCVYESQAHFIVDASGSVEDIGAEILDKLK